MSQVAHAGVLGRRALLADGSLTARDLVEHSLARIAALDGRLNAFQAVFAEQARADADRADVRLRAGDDSPLLGVPMAVKDSDPVAGHPAAWGTGSTKPAPVQDCERVRRLRQAGAIVVGTTRMPELALWPFTESATWGATRNPWSLSHTPGGSSGGSGAAVASGMVAAALASDGGGSIRIPAACCHLVGLKPTVGTVPSDPAEAPWEGLSACGVLTRDVADQAHVLSVLAGTDLRPLDVASLRIAYSFRATAPTRVSRGVSDGVLRALSALRALGHDVRAGDPGYSSVQAAFLPRFLVGVHGDHVELLDPTRTERRTRVLSALGARVPARALAAAHRRSASAAALPEGFDVLVTPVLPGPVQRVGRHRGLRTPLGAARVVPFTGAWNVTGQPALALPVGRTADGLPLAVQLVAAHGADRLLLSVAAQLEAVLGVHHDTPDSPGQALVGRPTDR